MSTTVKDRYGAQRRRPAWRVFFKPGWIISALFIVVFSYFAFTFLAPWQLGKDSEIVERNERIAEAFEHDPLPVSEVFSHGSIDPADEWRRVTLTGQYLPDSEVVLRMRASDSGPAVQVLTPFRATDGTTYLIHRGFEPTTGAGVPEYQAAPTTEVSIVGVARRNEVAPERQPFEESGHMQVYGINTEQIHQATGQELARDYIQLTEGEPGEITAMPIPKLDRGSHLSYGLQWIAFGVMAPLGLGYFIYAEIRERRRAKQEEAEMNAGAEAAGTPKGPESLESTRGEASQPLSRRERRKRFQEQLWDEGADSPTPARPDRYGK
ncbi:MULTISPECIES: SURF1 family protein [unclassified Corynebacterium]|uniref:SURF1 family cytochrome oxidase biogenesis protein n=1 Tax=unclassified Corynebacterium TaxID=2624378 RepID=UPI0029CA4C7E|nr:MULTISPECIES: SURF1 family protein [unclassified Corynebacterium]WPF65513.1 SURF1 family protein [Corynebacterium sp. 22KM0430]WPF68009.1 SURF1 family protein [Corynebacterium sp. 21KM1197]